MIRDDERKNATAVEQDFRHSVEIVVPPSGLGDKLNAMYDFHTRHGIAPKRGHGARRRDGGRVIRWCFADPAEASAFANEFGAK